MQSISIRHNCEMGHRLSLQPDSKCFHLHGHSWWIDLELFGHTDATGMIINFADVKSLWRTYLDQYFDHHMCLNVDDPLAVLIEQTLELLANTYERWGIRLIDCDPTVENMARIWGEAARDMFVSSFFPNVKGVRISVQEASTNHATWCTEFVG